MHKDVFILISKLEGKKKVLQLLVDKLFDKILIESIETY